eukprot:COSAG02_NODE_234_length_27784_cov_12.556872_12_plen_73_part_00
MEEKQHVRGQRKSSTTDCLAIRSGSDSTRNSLSWCVLRVLASSYDYMPQVQNSLFRAQNAPFFLTSSLRISG